MSGAAASGRSPASDGPGSEGLRMLVSGFIEGRFDQRSLTDGELFQGRDTGPLPGCTPGVGPARATMGSKAWAPGPPPSPPARWATDISSRSDWIRRRIPTRRFFNDIRPEEAYDVFGDASATLFEAQSKGRVFGAVSRGDFLPDVRGLQYLHLRRGSAPGALLPDAERCSHQYDTERAAVRAFASRDRFQQIVDEMPGMGISGPTP